MKHIKDTSKHFLNLPDRIEVFPDGANIMGANNVKFGIDPTFPKLHLGHMVPLRVVKKLKEQGKNITIVLGTFTAQLGDPSGKEKTRPILTSSQTNANANAILQQVTTILGEGFEVYRNGDLFSKMTVPEILQICSRFTVNFMLSRDAFQKRMESDASISLHELIVPICQGWDSVHLKSDIEIGGTDQLFNFQVARKLQENEGMNPEICLMMPIINGTDGRKMSKSLGNCIFLTESSTDIFGKCMSVSDETMDEWIPLLTDINLTDLPEHPMKRKKIMAFDIVKQLRGEKEAQLAEEGFKSMVQKSEIPDDMLEVDVSPEALPEYTSQLLHAIMLIRKCSKSEARRLMKGNAVSINDKKVNNDRGVELNSGDIVKIGKRAFGKIK